METFFTRDDRVVFLTEEPEDTFQNLLTAAQSSLDFWDNPFDDEDWNDA